MIEVAKTTSFHFKSDLPKRHRPDKIQSGILHLYRSSKHPTNPKQEHCFAWIVNANGQYKTKKGSCTVYDGSSTHTHLKETMSYLERFGFSEEKAKFVPFSSKEKWIFKYPHAYPYVECNVNGEVHGLPYWNPWANESRTTKKSLSSPDKTKNADIILDSTKAAAISTATAAVAYTDNNICTDGDSTKQMRRPSLLSVKQRDQFHIEVYDYFQWLNEELTMNEGGDENETNSSNRVSNTGISVEGIQSIIDQMEDVFEAVKERNDGMKAPANRFGIPFLEGILGPALRQRVRQLDPKAKDAPNSKRKQDNDEDDNGVTTSVKRRKKTITARSLDFDDMYEKLAEFHANHGHTSIPYNFKDDPKLGNWVCYIRKKKKEYDAFVADTNTNNDNDDNNKKQGGMLTREQIGKLESLDFAWILAPKPRIRYTWEERLEQLRQYHREHGTFRIPRTNGTLGEWLHKQRQFYNTNDERFLKHRYPKMLEIGFTFTKKPVGYQKSWDDRFEDLVSFGRVHGHFNVPCPDFAKDGDHSNNNDANASKANNVDFDEAEMEKLRFYKWVTKLRYDYKNARLTKNRLDKLNEIGFHIG